MNVKLTWTDRNMNETGHRIYRSSSPMDTQALPPPVAELGPNVTEWEDTDTPVDQVVYYIVSAVRGAEEAFSDEVMIDTGPTKDPYWDQVVTLLHFDGADGQTTTEDEKSCVVALTAGVYLSSAEVMFGTTSLKFDGSTGMATVTETVVGDLYLDSDFTFEWFAFFGSTAKCLFRIPSGPYFYNGKVEGEGYFTSILYNIQEVERPVWQHFALVANSGIIRLYVNGNQVGESTLTKSLNLNGIKFGDYNNNLKFAGYIDEVRITKGVARYTENFTPPTEPFPNFGPPPGPTPTLPTVIGEPYGGGFYAGDIEYPDGQWYKLIVADVSADITGANSRWKTTNTDTPGTAHLTDGVANTDAMVAAGIELHPAANHCVNHRGGDNADWYMPAKDELNVIYQNLGPTLSSTPDDFKYGNSQALTPTSYQSSSQYPGYNDEYAWTQHFQDGSQSSLQKKVYSGYRVRPIRRIAFTP